MACRTEGGHASGAWPQRVPTSGQSGLALSSRSARCGGQPRAAQAPCGLTTSSRCGSSTPVTALVPCPAAGGRARLLSWRSWRPARVGLWLSQKQHFNKMCSLCSHTLRALRVSLKSAFANSCLRQLPPAIGCTVRAAHACSLPRARGVGLPTRPHRPVLPNRHAAALVAATATPAAPGTASPCWSPPGEDARLRTRSPSGCGSLSHPAAGPRAPAAPPSRRSWAAPAGAGSPPRMITPPPMACPVTGSHGCRGPAGARWMPDSPVTRFAGAGWRLWRAAKGARRWGRGSGAGVLARWPRRLRRRMMRRCWPTGTRQIGRAHV